MTSYSKPYAESTGTTNVVGVKIFDAFMLTDVAFVDSEVGWTGTWGLQWPFLVLLVLPTPLAVEIEGMFEIGLPLCKH